MALYVTDTHPLIWYVTGAHSKLSRVALRTFERADRGEALIYVPAMALWEAGILGRIGRVRFNPSFEAWTRALVARPGFAFAPLDVDTVTSAIQTAISADPFDIGIVAAARVRELPLITKDEKITQSRIVQVAW